MPVIFVGHGSPLNALEDNPFTRTWSRLGESLPRPRAILCVSAHWQTPGIEVTAMEQPPLIYDFYGFPKDLYEVRYPVPGAPLLAREVQARLGKAVELDQEWGLDHGAWSVLRSMFPTADIPVFQLSLSTALDPAEHYRIARELAFLRNRGVLIVGSGNIVHNLSLVRWEDTAFPWALEFGALIETAIGNHDHEKLIGYEKLGTAARLSVPTPEHFLPLLYILALQDDHDQVQFFNRQVTMGSISMTGLVIGHLS